MLQPQKRLVSNVAITKETPASDNEAVDEDDVPPEADVAEEVELQPVGISKKDPEVRRCVPVNLLTRHTPFLVICLSVTNTILCWISSQ